MSQPPLRARLTAWLHDRNALTAVILRLLAAYFLAQTAMVPLSPSRFSTLEYAAGFDLVLFVCVFAVAFAFLAFVAAWRWAWYSDALAVGVGALAYGLCTVWRNDNLYYALGVVAVLALIGYFVLCTGALDRLPRPGPRLTVGIAVAFALLFALFVGTLTVLRYLSYISSCFDFGIFSQMFYYLKETLQPLTTCERQGLLSHFAVHASPIFYVLLPVYALFPSPITLQVLQAVILASGVIPLLLLCRHFHLSRAAALCFVGAYCLFPALIGGCFYDLHENKLLAPLILWLLYTIERKRWWGVALMALLVMMVKEDAPVYVACIALYIVFYKKDTYHGLLLLCFSLAYFGGVTWAMSAFGQGVMTGRYDNFITDPSQGLVGVIRTCLVNPAYVIHECFNSEKFEFILKMLVPLGFLPLATRKLSQWWLLVPFVLINLMSDYQYQHSIFFQYTYGVTALLFYLAIVNAASLRTAARRYWLSLVAVASVVFSVALMSGQLWYVDYYRSHQEVIEQTNAVLDAIPDDASVEATTYYVPRLSQRRVVYMSVATADVKWDPTDYVVLKVDATQEEFVPERIEDLLAQGYVYDSGVENVIAVYRYAPEHA